MSKKIKITLILIFILFIGLSTNVLGYSNPSDYIDSDLISIYNSSLPSNGWYTLNSSHKWCYIETSTYKVIMVGSSLSGYDDETYPIYRFCLYLSANSYNSYIFWYDSDDNYVGGVSAFIKIYDYDYNDVTSTSAVSSLLSTTDYTMINTENTDLVGSDHVTPVFQLVLPQEMITEMLTVEALTPTAVMETIQTTLKNLIPVSLRIFATFLAISLIVYVIFRLL